MSDFRWHNVHKVFLEICQMFSLILIKGRYSKTIML